MIEIRQTDTFREWLLSLRDARAKQKIASRIQRLRFGNPGDVKPVGAGVSEMRINEGPGYRVYFVQRGSVLVVLLCGGTKRRQQADIEQAKRLAAEMEG
ncbi:MULTISPECIES: type II toxin-antitoxin system RelE/ParE family toxin [Paracoccus]|mgnify:CR=1 FL=1|uniref:Type II toxin-antitoxin system RelE/ParE family toxin n=1 Tax=Paracoccus pantotrophus TaxID=82367 RepID=A0A7H9BRU3_PARPN|nr:MULTISPECIES: type II toxin-antitoxin system RelE/ParE family toxin [Paracoccus]MDF3856202.1 type II toxin-antitoxin system RelE/ParE family toxin [Paracoccus pantotrophus]QLH14080.1 type II toxin-antitoxin system RelE/ParE family toxin [Paracoccus pantotrophus]SFP01619.1 putative addiction module killer protein [Paracoccus pantotrophus]